MHQANEGVDHEAGAISSTSALAMVATTSKLLRRWREEPLLARPES
jgi:hypothetical protein